MLNESLLMSRFPEIAVSTRKPYLIDLSDHEWEVIKPLLPDPKGFGCPRNVDLREILNAIFPRLCLKFTIDKKAIIIE